MLIAAVAAVASACAAIMGVEEATLIDPNLSDANALNGDGSNNIGTNDGSVDPFDTGCVIDCPQHPDASNDAAVKDGSVAIDGGVDAAASVTALSFDGVNDTVRLARHVQDDFTLEAWIKTTASSAGGNFFEGLPVIYADVFGVANDFGTSILNGRFAFGAVSNTIQSTTIVATGQWIHVAAVRVRTTGALRVLINGTQEATVNGSTAALTAPTGIDIGGNTIDNRYFSGLIDEVRIWNVARSAAQIQASMKVKLVGNEAGLVGYWRFDDGSGTNANDSSPSNNDGNLGNNNASARPTWVVSGAF